MYPYLSNIMPLMAIAYASGLFLYSGMIPPAIVQSVLLYVLLLRLWVLTLR